MRMMRLVDIIHNYSLLFFFPTKINTVTSGDLYIIVGNDECDLCISLVQRWFTGTSPRPAGRVAGILLYFFSLCFVSSIHRLNVTFVPWGGCVVHAVCVEKIPKSVKIYAGWHRLDTACYKEKHNNLLIHFENILRFDDKLN